MSNVATLDRAPAKRSLIANMAEQYGLDPKLFEETIRKTVMPKDHTIEEFAACMMVAKDHELNPFTREIYFMRTKSGQIQPIVSIDGWVKITNRHPAFDGLDFADVLATRELVSITCRIYRKDRSRPVEVTEYMAECRGQSPAWKQTPSRMLRHRSLMQCARYAFGFAGIMDRDEFDQWQNLDTPRMRDVTPAKATGPEVPDIPDEPAEPEVTDPPIADEAGYLERLQSLRDQCESIHELQEIAVNEASMIARLTEAGQTVAARILQEE